MDLINERISELMEDNGYSIPTMSAQLGIPIANLYRWKTKPGNRFTLSHFLMLADAFHCNLDYLAGRTDLLIAVPPQSCPLFYQQIQTIMQRAGISRYRLVKNSGVVYDNHFTQWKNGSEPTLETLIKLADYFSITLDELVGRSVI